MYAMYVYAKLILGHAPRRLAGPMLTMNPARHAPIEFLSLEGYLMPEHTITSHNFKGPSYGVLRSSAF